MEDPLLPDDATTDVVSIVAKRKKALRSTRLFTAVLMSAAFVVYLVLLLIRVNANGLDSFYKTMITTEFVVYNATGEALAVPTERGPATLQSEVLGSWPIAFVVLGIPVISAIINYIISCTSERLDDYLRHVVQDGYSPERWLKQGLTAPIIVWVALQIAGVTELFLLVSVALVMTLVNQLLGYTMELLNPNDDKMPPAYKNVNWTPYVAWIVMFASQTAIVLAHFIKLAMSVRPEGVVIPFYTYAIPIGIIFLFAMNPLLLGIRYTSGKDTSSYRTEMAFLWLDAITDLYFVIIFMLVVGLGIAA
jgi:hypothetical protein